MQRTIGSIQRFIY